MLDFACLTSFTKNDLNAVKPAHIRLRPTGEQPSLGGRREGLEEAAPQRTLLGWHATQGLARSMRPSGLASGVAGSRQVVSLWQFLCKTYVGLRVFNFIYKK